MRLRIHSSRKEPRRGLPDRYFRQYCAHCGSEDYGLELSTSRYRGCKHSRSLVSLADLQSTLMTTSGTCFRAVLGSEQFQ
eukprot:11536844-Alexandrium_andersonii.AAC.1